MVKKNVVQTKPINLSKGYSLQERKAIAQDFIDYIVDRTRKGKGKGGKDWRKGSKKNPGPGRYSESYKKSFEFKAKTSKGKVTLELFGDMLSSIEKLPSGSSEVIVGVPKGDADNAKAEGNILGSYGGKPNKKKARPFLDMTKSEINKILRPYRNKKTTEERVAAFAAAKKLAAFAAANESVDEV